MADTKISDLTDGSVPAADDVIPVARSGGSNRKLSITQLFASPQPIGSTSPSTGSFSTLVATSVNKVAITTPATGSTLTVAEGKTLTASNTVTLTATDGSTLNIGTGGTLGSAAYTATTAYDAAGAAAAVTPTSLGLVIGTNTQAYNLKLTTIAALANGTGWLYNDGSGVFSYSVPTTVSGNAGTATTLATARAIYGNNFDGSAALTQVIASTYGGTGNGYTKFSGPTSTEKTFTLPDASDTVACLGQAQTFTKAQRGSFVALTDAATVAVDLSLSNQFSLVLGGNRTLGVPTNIVKGQQGVISIRQDSTGSRTLAYAWPYEWAGGTAGTLTTAGCSRDQLVYSVEEYATSTVTITNATPGVVSWTAHGLENGQRVQLTTTGALPTGLTASTTYFVAGKGTNDFKLSTTLANAAAGTYIATSSAGSGTHTCVACSISVALNKAYA